MASRKRSRSGRVLLLTILVLAALASAYGWAWFHYAAELKDAARDNLATLATEGRQAECPAMRTGGFPLGLQLSCDGFVYRDPDKGVAIETGPVRSEARVYDPLAVASSFDGPAIVVLKGYPTLRFEWDSLTANMRLSRPLPERADLAGSNIVASFQDGGQRLLHAASARLRANPVEDDLDLKLDFGSLALGESLLPGIDLPPLDGAADIAVDNGMALLVQPPKSPRGLSVDVKSASLSSGEAALAISGPVAVDRNGLLNARLSVTVRRPQEIAALLGDALPRMRDQIETAFAALAMLGDNTTLPLKISKGEASIGFIKIGKIPPL